MGQSGLSPRPLFLFGAIGIRLDDGRVERWLETFLKADDQVEAHQVSYKLDWNFFQRESRASLLNS